VLGVRFAVSNALLEFGRINDVGKKQSQQSSPMFALKFFTLCPSLYRDLLHAALDLPGIVYGVSTRASAQNPYTRAL
jgi:hypothetical protein